MNVAEIEAHEPLDAAQRAVVDVPEPRIVVEGGPGTGKTHCLLARARRLAAASPDRQALVLAGTNDAANELRRRVAPGGAEAREPRIRVRTFHELCFELVRDDGERVGAPPRPQVLDVEGAAKLLDLGDSVYEDACRSQGYLDFETLSTFAVELVRDHEDVARAWGARFPHLLVDDAQNATETQLALVRALAPHVRTLSVFADENQAIFGWVDADPEELRRLVAWLRPRVLTLGSDHRCPERIHVAAERLIAHDPERRVAPAGAVRAGGAVVSLAFDDVEEEAEQIAEAIAARLDGPQPGGCRPGDVAVLARTWERASWLIDELADREIPLVVTWGELPWRATLAACLAAMGRRLHPAQRRRLCQLVNVPIKTEVAGDPLDPQDLLTELAVGLRKPLAADLLALRARAADLAPYELARELVALMAHRRRRFADAVEPLTRLIELRARDGDDRTVEDLLSWLALVGEVVDPAVDAVRVASLHRATGLEWRSVFVLGFEEETLPLFRCSPAEERRVAYSGIARASSELVLSRVATFRGDFKDPSRFLDELGVLDPAPGR